MNSMQTSVQQLRGRLYDLHWEVRARLSDFDLKDGLRLLQDTQWWPRARLDDLRDAKLRATVAHAYEHIPHYRHLMEERGVRPRDIRGAQDLPRLPVMTKDDLRAHAAELRADDIDEAHLERGITGGTTGQPMRVVRDYAGTTWQRAAYWRGFGWGGLTLEQPWVQLFGGSLGHQATRPLNRLRNWMAGKVFLPAFELGAHNVARYVDEIKAARAQFLVGYASACHQLAVLVERAGLTLPLTAAFPTAELLPDEWRATIARVFGAKVLPYYGCGEVQSLGYSCPDADEPVYHSSDEHVVLEVERSDGSAALEGSGAFLVTDLDNRAMPLIRYRNGDAGTLAPPGCSCGRTLGRILRLDGRVNDVLITTRGDRISGVIGTHTFRLVENVEAYQIVQKRPGQATLKLVRGPGYDASVEEPKMRDIFRKHLGETAEIDVTYVESIPRTAAGKARFVINEYLAAGQNAPPPDASAGLAITTRIAS